MVKKLCFNEIQSILIDLANENYNIPLSKNFNLTAIGFIFMIPFFVFLFIPNQTFLNLYVVAVLALVGVGAAMFDMINEWLRVRVNGEVVFLNML